LAGAEHKPRTAWSPADRPDLATNPVAVTGAIWPETSALPLLTLPVTVAIGGENTTVLHAGASPLNSSGTFQVNVLLPAGLSAGSQSLVLNIGTASAAVAISVP
jgi:uncharacterized protein (TIGR03437 family)